MCTSMNISIESHRFSFITQGGVIKFCWSYLKYSMVVKHALTTYL